LNHLKDRNDIMNIKFTNTNQINEIDEQSDVNNVTNVIIETSNFIEISQIIWDNNEMNKKCSNEYVNRKFLNEWK
jgi:hypothetical protein